MNTRNRSLFRFELGAAVAAAAALLGSCVMVEDPDEVAMQEESQAALLDTQAVADEQLAALDEPAASPLDAPPDCVTTELDDSGVIDYLTVFNDCDHDVRVKVVLAFATDFACVTIPAGGAWDYQWAYPGRFDRLESC